MSRYRGDETFPRRSLTRIACALVLGLWVLTIAPAVGHIYIPRSTRAGGYPREPGRGWFAEAFLYLPDSAVQNTITAENYVSGRQPDFTFRTDWIDFPIGPVGVAPDKNFAIVRDFLGSERDEDHPENYIYDVSDPLMLDEPMSHMVLRFTGLVRVVIEDEVRIREIYGLPIWVELGSLGYDGFIIRMGNQICYERPDSNFADPWFNFGPSLAAQGLFPADIFYYNRYDPGNVQNAPNGGFELYSWHGGGLALPGGLNMVHTERGQGTLVPPWLVYQPGDELPLPPGDFDADIDVDIKDFQWFQNCYFPPDGTFIILPDGCETFDFTPDNDVDPDDFRSFFEYTGDPQ